MAYKSAILPNNQEQGDYSLPMASQEASNPGKSMSNPAPSFINMNTHFFYFLSIYLIFLNFK